MKSSRAKSKPKSKSKVKAFSFWRSKQTLVVGLLFVALFGGIGVWMLTKSDAAATDIDTTDKAAVNSAYWRLWGDYSAVTSGWDGSVKACDPGMNSVSARVVQRNAVNFARQLAGLTPIVAAQETSTAQANVQRAALMMDANDTISHSPPSSWLCYRSNGATAASQSNLGIGGTTTSGTKLQLKPLTLIASYFRDGGDSNKDVGHRRWLLYPPAYFFAFGNTDHAGVTQVVGLPTKSTNSNPSYVPWPTDHWFPDTLDPGSASAAGKWSLTGRSNSCFNNATVLVTRNSVRVSTSILSRSTRHYGNPTIVWSMPANLDHSSVYAYVVKVSNINVVNSTGACSTSSTTSTSFQYPVRFFTPYK